MKHKVIVIVGPTAIGKTELSIRIAKKYNMDIISGDSIAVYKEYNIGSAKPTLEEQALVHHHLIDVMEACEEYSVADFQRSARKIIDSNPLSIICGGTGLYIQAVLQNYEFQSEKRNPELQESFKEYSNEQLYQYLLRIDPGIDQEKLHPNNRKRVLRAIEIYQSSKQSIHSINHKNEALYDSFIIYLTMEREQLYQRIHSRVDKMLEKGLFEEVKALKKKNIPLKGIGYKEWEAYFSNEKSYEEVIEDIKKNTRHLAKRQETWFKNQMDTHIYEVTEENRLFLYEQIEQDIEGWLLQ